MDWSRPPLLRPRRRRIHAEVERRIRSWIEARCGVAGHETISLQEWISLDLRVLPAHMVMIVVGEGRDRRRLTIGKAAERIVEHDIEMALSRGASTNDGAVARA